MAIEDIVVTNITLADAKLTRAGFDTILIAAADTPFAGNVTVQEYSSLPEMVTAGFAVTAPAYLAAAAIFAQSPRVTTVKVGVRGTATVQTHKLTPINTTEGYVYAFTVNGVPVTYTVLASSSVLIIVTALQTLVNAITDVTAVNDTTHLTVDSATGVLIQITDMPGVADMTLVDLSAATGLATDLGLIAAADDDWYGLVLDSQSLAEIAVANTWAQSSSTPKLHVYSTADSAALDSGSTADALAVANAASQTRNVGFFHPNPLSYPAAAMLGVMFPQQPGSASWNGKVLVGVNTVSLSTSQQSAVFGKKGNIYTNAKGVGFTLSGTVASGRFADTIRFIDWLREEINTGMVRLFATNPKIPYTDRGVTQVISVVDAALQEGVDVGGLSDDPAPQVTAPKVADVSSADKSNRILPNVQGTATLAGGIHTVNVDVSIGV